MEFSSQLYEGMWLKPSEKRLLLSSCLSVHLSIPACIVVRRMDTCEIQYAEFCLKFVDRGIFWLYFDYILNNLSLCKPLSGPGSSVDIATGYGLDGLGIESRWGSRFSVPVQTGPGTHPASCTMGTGSFSGVKSGRDVTLTTHHLLVPWSRKSRAIPLLP